METLKQLVGRVLGVNPDDLNNESSPENISSWNSFNGLMLISELEKNFKVNFTMDEVISVKNFGDIKKTLKNHKVNEGIE